MQTVVVPVMVPADGDVVTVAVVVVNTVPHAPVTVKVMVAVPPATPVITPVVGLIVAIDVALLLQVPVPPENEEDSVDDTDGQTVVVPVMLPTVGCAFTVIDLVT